MFPKGRPRRVERRSCVSTRRSPLVGVGRCREEVTPRRALGASRSYRAGSGIAARLENRTPSRTSPVHDRQMSRQLWGTYSVNDHCIPSAFVADLVLYDRLVVPVPPSGDHAEFKRWQDNGWRPERLQRLLEVEGVGSFVRQVPWDAERRADWKQMQPARADGADQGKESDDAFGHAAEDLETTSEGAREVASSGMDPFGNSRRVLRMALTQEVLDGADARVLAVYTSADRFDRHWRIKKSFPFFSRETTVARNGDDFDVERLTVEEQETLAARDELASVLVGDFALP